MSVRQSELFDLDVPPGAEDCRPGLAHAARPVVTARIRRKIWAYVRACGSQGATCDEIEVALALRHQTASGQLRGLVMQRLVRDSGRRRNTRSGRTATVWIRRAPR